MMVAAVPVPVDLQSLRDPVPQSELAEAGQEGE